MATDEFIKRAIANSSTQEQDSGDISPFVQAVADSIEIKNQGVLSMGNFVPTLSESAGFLATGEGTRSSTPIQTDLNTVELLKQLGQGVARGFGATGAALENLPREVRAAVSPTGENLLAAERGRFFTPEGNIQEAIFGTDQPFSLATEGSDITFGALPEESFFAPFVGGLASILDLTTGGGGSKGLKGLVSAIKGANKVDDVVPLMKSAGFSDQVINDYADILVRQTDSVEIERSLLAAQDIQNATVARQAPAILNYIDSQGNKVYTPLTADEVLRIKNEVEKIPEGSRQIHIDTNITSETQRIGRAVTREEFMKQHPQARQVLDEVSKTKERGFISSVKEQFPEVRAAGRYIPRSTDELAIKARNLIRDDIDTAERLVREGTGQRAVATAAELVKHYNQAKRYDDAARIANEFAEKLTEQGRAVQAASILGRMTPEGQLRFAAREIQRYNETVEKTKGRLFGLKKKIPELTPEQTKEISERMTKITKMEDGVEKAMEFHKLQNKISSLVPSPLYKKLINLWKAGLLTGLKTSGLNIFSSLFNGVSEFAKDVPAVAVDSVISLFSKERTVALTARGVGGGVADGFKKGIRYMKTGFDERNVAAKLDYRKVNFGNSKTAKALQTYEETIFRLMGAEDQPFYYGAKARSVASQAIAQGKTKKLKGQELQKFIDDLIENPTDKMLVNAQNDAEIAVFQNRTLLGDVARRIQRIPGGEVVVPFGRTPSAVAMQLVNYSPVGIAKTIVENIGKGRFDQRAFSQGIGRGITGTAAMYIGTKLFEKGLLSLNYPDSDRERRQWELEGRKENAFKTPDGKWRSVAVLGPLGFVAVVGGYYQRAMEGSGSHSDALAQASLGGFQSLSEQTFLRGLNQFTDAIGNPEGYALPLFAGLVGSGVPTIVSDIARATDEFERETNPKREGFLARLKSRVPGVRQTLEPKIDVVGRPIEIAGNALETMIDPTRPTRIKSSVLIEELRRLFEAGMPATPTSFGNEKKFLVLTQDQRTRLKERAGSILEGKLTNLVQLPAYKELADDEKQKKIQSVVEKAREVARAEMVEERVADLEGEELRSELSTLKEAGFLTRGVYNTWFELFR